MQRLREKINPEEVQGGIERPTKYKTARNQSRLHCTQCGEAYYVDNDTFQKAKAPLEGDASEINFYCDECEELMRRKG